MKTKAVVLAIGENGYLIATNKKCFHGLSHNVNINIICTDNENCFFGGCTLYR